MDLVKVRKGITTLKQLEDVYSAFPEARAVFDLAVDTEKEATIAKNTLTDLLSKIAEADNQLIISEGRLESKRSGYEAEIAEIDRKVNKHEDTKIKDLDGKIAVKVNELVAKGKQTDALDNKITTLKQQEQKLNEHIDNLQKRFADAYAKVSNI